MRKPRSRKHDEHCPNLPVIVYGTSGTRNRATITRLWYDGCEIASREQFHAGEQIEVAIGGMGHIRARVTRCQDGTVFVRFDEECPV